MSVPSKGIITIAHGKPRYLKMALNLGRALKYNSPKIPRVVVSDAPPEYFRGLFDQVIPINRDYGRNVEQKLHLDLYSPFDQTLFIDADSLVTRDMDPIFTDYEGMSFTSPGFVHLSRGMDPGQWDLDLDAVLDRFKVHALPKFNGGLYYFEKNETARALFETARDLMKNYKDYGIADFRGCGPPDEILLSIAMACHAQDVVADEGRFMRTLFGLQGKLQMDTLGGGSSFNKSGGMVEPSIVHFASWGIYHPAYARECVKLRATVDPEPLPAFLIRTGVPVIWLGAFIRWNLMQSARKFRNFIR